MAKNFKITAKENGNEYWISRAVAVVGVVIGVKNGNISSFLVSQRGPGCPDFIGSWACTCGYLDWDETAEDGVVRELYEELGIKVSSSKANLWKVITDPKRDARQNVILRYIIPIDQNELEEMVEQRRRRSERENEARACHIAEMERKRDLEREEREKREKEEREKRFDGGVSNTPWNKNDDDNLPK